MYKKLPCLCQTLPFLARLHILNLCFKYCPTIESLAAVFTTASSSSPAICNLTVNSGICGEVHLVAGNVLLIRFLSALVNLAWSFASLSYQTSSLSSLDSSFYCQRLQVFLLLTEA